MTDRYGPIPDKAVRAAERDSWHRKAVEMRGKAGRLAAENADLRARAERAEAELAQIIRVTKGGLLRLDQVRLLQSDLDRLAVENADLRKLIHAARRLRPSDDQLLDLLSDLPGGWDE